MSIDDKCEFEKIIPSSVMLVYCGNIIPISKKYEKLRGELYYANFKPKCLNQVPFGDYILCKKYMVLEDGEDK